jgi:hypothetical protein
MSMLLSVAAFIGAMLIVRRKAWSLKFAGSMYAVLMLSYEIYVLLGFLRGAWLPYPSEIEYYSLKNAPLVIYFWEVGKFTYRKLTRALHRPADSL